MNLFIGILIVLFILIIFIIYILLSKREHYELEYQNGANILTDINPVMQQITPQDIGYPDKFDRNVDSTDRKRCMKEGCNYKNLKNDVDNSAMVEEVLTTGPDTYEHSSLIPDPQNNTMSADDSIMRNSTIRGRKNKDAIDGYIRHTRNTFDKYFVNELHENEQREWWGASDKTIETDYNPYE